MMSVPSARSGIDAAQPVDEAEVALEVVRAPHRLQEAARPRLERQMDLLAHRGALGHRRDHRLAEVLRVRAREADPLDPFDRVASAEQLAELGADLRREVAAPRVHVLAEQRQLTDAVARQPGHLGDDLSRPPADLAAANRRDDAVRALGVAAHRDLHPRLERACPVRRQLPGERPLDDSEAAAIDADAPHSDPVGEMRDRARSERHVDERIELEDPLALGLRVAAAHGDHAVRLGLLQRPRLREMRGEPLVGLLPDRARVEDDHVRLVLRHRLAETDRLEHPGDPLGVVRVHLAPERGDVEPLHRRIVARYLANSVARDSRMTVTLI